MGMGFCKRRYLFLTICILQVLSTVERQIFDFLGYMWAPILANFLHVIFVIFGFFGAYQYRSKYIATYVVWDVLWIGWNIFIICFYLDVGILDKNSDILNLGTGSFSWWEVNGIGCKPVYPTNLTSEGPDPFKPLRPEKVLNCVLDYQYVEILHASFQLLLAVFGIMGAILLSHIFVEEDDSSPIKKKIKNKRTSLYSIEYTTREDSHNVDDSLEYDHRLNGVSHIPTAQLSPRPMTPRRVKRRSGISRNSTSTTQRTSGRYSTTSRSSVRSSGKRSKNQPQNPVTRLIEQQHTFQHKNIFADSSTSNDSNRLNGFNASSSQADLLSNSSGMQWKKATGHSNPMYQQNSSQSLNEEDDSFGNRPASARSSYSNYHGTRPISCYVGPGGLPSYYVAGQATPQVPVNTHRRSNHSIPKSSRPSATFLSSGPPAYDVQAPIDSETVI